MSHNESWQVKLVWQAWQAGCDTSSEQFAEGINRGGEGDLLVAGGDSKR